MENYGISIVIGCKNLIVIILILNQTKNKNSNFKTTEGIQINLTMSNFVKVISNNLLYQIIQ